MHQRHHRKWVILGLTLVFAAAYGLSMCGWFYADDAITLTDSAAVLDDPPAVFSPGTFGRFRPLRLSSVAVVYALAGTRTAVPYHLLSLALHLLNLLLMHRLLHRLIDTKSHLTAAFIPLAATAIMAIHWAGSEAVTYLSAIGILYSTTGALIACLGARNLGEFATMRRTLFALLQLAAGMLISISGGYALATIPAALICALWPRGDSRRLTFRPVILTAAVLIPLTVAYAAMEKFLVARNLENQIKFDPGFMLHQMGESIARLYLPSYFVNEPIVLWILAATALFILLFKPARQTFTEPKVWLLLILALACLLPYAPSNLGNRNRFCYLPSAFFAAFVLLLILGTLQRWPKTTPTLLRWVMTASVATFLIVNIAGMQARVFQANHKGENLRQFLSQVETIKNASRAQGREPRLFMTGTDPEQGLHMLRLTGVLTTEQTIRSDPPALPPPEAERWLIATYRQRDGFQVRTEPPLR